MSADNIIYVKKHEGKWYAWDQSASTDPEVSPRAVGLRTKTAALALASRLQARLRYVEYGINVLTGK